MEYLFAQGDRYLNEVLEERRLKREQSSSPQTPLPSAAQEAPNCTKENEQQIHCFTHYSYEEWRNSENKENDYDNCIGLNL